jgi:ribosome biogenesis ATPase
MDSSPSSRRSRRHDTSSSSTSYSEHGDDGCARPPSPPPAFDVTKDMLRTRYATLTPKKDPAAAAASQQLEIEVSTEKPRRRITSDGGGEQEAAAASEGGGGGGKGPRFADLGGMEAVIAELMMEVVVPLCHPELPQRLGVRPVAGILLHGPPGCGKTTLAHAIANETGVPFYKISAPEVVSGVSGMLSDSCALEFLSSVYACD